MGSEVIQSHVQNPEFWKLSRTAQIEVLDSVDPQFSSLPLTAKNEVITSFVPGRPDMSPKPLKSLGMAIAEEAPAAIGGIAGGIAGAPGGVVGSAAGAAAGATAGEAVKEIVKNAIGMYSKPKSGMEIVEQAGKRGLEEGLFQGGAGMAVKAARKVIAPFSGKVIPEAKEVIDAYGNRISPTLLPSEATESRLLDVAQNVAEYSLVGGGKVSAFKAAREKEFDKIAGDIVDQYGSRMTPEEIGEEFVNIIKGKQSIFKREAQLKYGNVDQLAAGIDVPTDALKTFAAPIQQRSANISNIKAASQGDDLINAVVDLPERLTFQEAQDLRSRLLSIAEEFSVQNKNAPAIGKAKAMVRMLDGEMDKALKANPAAYTAWREANQFYREGSERLNNQFIRKLIRAAEENGTGPEVVGSMIFKPGAISNIKKIKTAVDPQDWTKFQGFYAEHLMRQSSKDGVVQGQLLLNNMVGKPGSMGDPTLREIFSPDQIKELRNFANAVRLSQAKQGEGTGRVWIQLTQAGAVMAPFVSDFDESAIATAGAFIIGPALLSRVLTNPRTARLLTTGFKLPAGSEQAAGITARLLNEMNTIRKETHFGNAAPAEGKQQAPSYSGPQFTQ